MSDTKPSTDRFVFLSSPAAEVWHSQKEPKAYEWWYFDALSDDGSEAIVIVFLDNYIYSPRYNNQDGMAGVGIENHRFPAVSFSYFKEGKLAYRTRSEFSPDQFSAGGPKAKCTIGESGFRFESASYGAGYLVSVNLPLSRGRRLRANLEWLSVESNFGPTADKLEGASHCWNLVAPRSDVSGKITVEDPHGQTRESHSFRGTGYHDHNLDNRWLADSVKEWHWGRVHFADSTAVFCRYSPVGDGEAYSRVILVRDGRLVEDAAGFVESGHSHDLHGLRYPRELQITTDSGVSVSTKTQQVIDSSFYHLRFLSQFELTAGGKTHAATGITEFIAPRALKRRWLTWLGDLRTGKNGKAPVI